MTDLSQSRPARQSSETLLPELVAHQRDNYQVTGGTVVVLDVMDSFAARPWRTAREQAPGG